MKVLISGGAGYIGSTIASALLDGGHTPVLLDSLVTGRREFTKDRIFYEADIADRAMVRKIFSDHPDIEATIHCAALIVVPESVERPYDYYKENVVKSMEFFKLLAELGRKRVVFSSSAAVYDVVPGFMVTEESPLRPLSPYSRTKYMMEMVLKDFCDAYDMRGIALRYFNPIGADPQMRTGLPTKEPSLVVGRMVEVAMGRIPEFHVTGTTWPTRDGTGIRDYIHVWDLARAHVMALTNFDQAFERTGNPDQRYLVINLGSGNGVTVRELVNAFENVLGREIPKKDMPARPGDVAGAYANDDKARTLLGWQPEMSVEQCIADAIKWGEKRKEVLGY